MRRTGKVPNMIAPLDGASLSPITPHSLQLQPILVGDRLKSCNRWRVSAEGATICLNTKTRKHHSQTPGSMEEDKPPPNHVLLPPCRHVTVVPHFHSPRRRRQSTVRVHPKLLADPFPTINVRRERLVIVCVSVTSVFGAPHLPKDLRLRTWTSLFVPRTSGASSPIPLPRRFCG